MFLLILMIFFLTNTIVANSRCSNIPECSGCLLCHMTIMWRPIRANFQQLSPLLNCSDVIFGKWSSQLYAYKRTSHTYHTPQAYHACPSLPYFPDLPLRPSSRYSLL